MPVLVIDKPKGPTSFAVVKTVARQVRAYRAAGGQGIPDPARIGHGGTLDPMATGVLPVCIGEATKLAPFLLEADKAYEATIGLGVQHRAGGDDEAGTCQHLPAPASASQRQPAR